MNVMIRTNSKEKKSQTNVQTVTDTFWLMKLKKILEMINWDWICIMISFLNLIIIQLLLLMDGLKRMERPNIYPEIV